jgi:hypothetical protein
MRRKFNHTSVTPPKSQKTPYRQYILLVIAAALIGFLAQFQWLGSIAVGVYAIYALWGKVPSRMTFMMALMALGLVPVAVVIGRWLVAQNFGAYSFLLFVVGLISLTLELRRATHSLRNKHNAKQ